jgi:serine/threonine protein kinase
MVASQQSGWPETKRTASGVGLPKILSYISLTCQRNERWVAIKFITADASSTQGRAEMLALQTLRAHCSPGSGQNHTIQLLDHFVHKGPNGSHTCLVLELLGPSLNSVIQQYSDRKHHIPAKTIFKYSKQLLQAVEFLHSSGMAHGGKLIL